MLNEFGDWGWDFYAWAEKAEAWLEQEGTAMPPNSSRYRPATNANGCG